jgi:TP901 family phage tail tape measure protein
MAADRITRVSLVANVSNYITGMNQAAAATRATGTAAERLAQQRAGIETLGKALLAVGVVAAAGVALAVKKYAEFDAAVSGIQAATHATTADMNLLRDAAIEAGAKTVYSATEAANAITELSKAGVSTKDILGGGLTGALSLASAGELDVADAAQIAATAMTQFGLKGSQVPHVADLLAAGAGKAQGSVQDLAAALNQGGLVASQAGQSIEDTTGVLAAFAAQGLLGSDAGTSLKTALLALESPSTQAAGVMKQYGIDVYDAQGNMDSFQEIAGTLQTKLGGLTAEQRNAALSTIFGNDAVRAANVLYSDGAKGIQDWTKKVNDNGYAVETARLKMDNFSGDLENLKGSLDTALIKTGSNANGILRAMAQSATLLVNSFGSAPAPLLAAGLALGTLVAAIGLVGGGALLAVPKLIAFRDAMRSVGTGGRAAAIGIGALSVGLTAATLVIGYFVAQQAEAKANTDQLTQTLDSATGALTKYSRAFVSKQLADSGAFRAAKEAGVGQRELTDAVLEGGKALDEVKGKLDANNTIGSFFTGEGIRAGNAKDKIVSLNQSVDDSRAAFKDLKASGGDVAGSTDDVASAAADATTGLTELSGAADTGKSSLDDLKKAIEGFGSAQLDVDSATRGFYESVDKLTQSVKDNGQSLDVTTEKGRNNQSALDDIASSTLSLSSATLTQTGSQQKAAAVIDQGRAAFIKAAGQLGVNAAQAAKLADKLGLIPANVATAVTQTGVDPAIAKLDALIAKIRDVPGYKAVVIDQQIRQTGAAPGAVKAAYNAEGGAIRGPGSGTSDSILSFLSNGEYVVKASSVSKYGVAYLDALNNGKVQKFATGGYVQNLAAAQKQYDSQVKYQKAAEAALSAAKSARRKADARSDLAEAKADVAAAKKRLDAAKAAPQGASLSDKLSFRSSTRDGSFDADKGISSLYSMAQDSSAYSGKQRSAFLSLASKDEVALNKLEKQSDRAADAVKSAADKLSDLKDKSESLASSVASNLSGSGISSGQTATGFRKSQALQKTQLTQLAALLKKLKGKGLDPALLAQIAGLDPAVALQTAQSFDALSSSAVKSVNSDYKSVQSTAASIGRQVADANFGPQIKQAQAALDNADRNAAAITKAIGRESEKLRKVIGKALGLPGYAAGGHIVGAGSGTSDSINARLSNGEFVVNAAATRRNRLQLEAINRGFAVGGYVQPTYVRSSGAGSGIDYGQLAAALRAQPREVVSAQIIQQPIRDQNPRTAAVLAARELERELRKHK